MLFPLLLSLSQRVAALLSSVMLGLVALAATLLFAKKAFLLSAAALAIAAWDANRKKTIEPAPQIHLHSRIPIYHREYYEPEHYEEGLRSDYFAPQGSDYATPTATASHKYGITEKSHGQMAQANSQIPYRSHYRYRKGRG